MGPLIVIDDVVAGYVPRVNILNGVNLVLAPGELIGIIGPNGAGKSTMLKALFGLITINSGIVTYYRDKVGPLEEETHYVGGSMRTRFTAVEDIEQAVRTHRDRIAEETLAVQLMVGDETDQPSRDSDDGGMWTAQQTVDVDGRSVRLALRKDGS